MAERSRFKKTVFGNGLTLVTERLTQFQSLSLGVWVKVGTRHERSSEAGVSHFLEHMLFKGTKSRSALKIALEIDKIGGEFNAFTTREFTCFHLLLLNQDYQSGLEILMDVLLNSNFSAIEIERERKVILQEISMVEESPEELAHDLYFELIYGGHGLGRPILGTRNSISKMGRAEMTRFFYHHYRPDQIILSVAGNVSHDEVIRKIRPLTEKSWYGRKPTVKSRNAMDLESLSPSKSSTIKSGAWWVERETEQVHLIWGVPGPHYASEDRFASFLLNVYLGGGMSSTLFQEIREKSGLAYTVYSNLSPFIDSGIFSIYVGTSVNQLPLCLKLVEKSIGKIKKSPIKKNELKIIQNNLKGSILLSSDCVESRMSSIAKNEMFLGRYYSLNEICKLVDQVTPQDIQRVAHRIFQKDLQSVLILGPKPKSQILNQLRPWIPSLERRY